MEALKTKKLQHIHSISQLIIVEKIAANSQQKYYGREIATIAERYHIIAIKLESIIEASPLVKS